MDINSIPKKYGGRLGWSWGDAPDLDGETRKALEKDGHKGWVKGPALWLNNERIVVGSQNGKPRRSDKEIAEKKPIIYAADYTEVPVHQEKRRESAYSGHRQSVSSKAPVKKEAGAREDSPSTLVGKKNTPPGSATAAPATRSSLEQRPATPKQAPTTPSHPGPAAAPTATRSSTERRPVTPKQAPAIPSHMSPKSVRNSPMGDSMVHVPDAQPGQPATTVEYISPVTSTEAVPDTTTTATPVSAPKHEDAARTREPKVTNIATRDSASRPVSAAPVVEPTTTDTAPKPAMEPPHIEPTTTTSTAAAAAGIMAQPSTTFVTHTPPGHTQPGALPRHTVELSRKIADQLSQESTVVIPADGSGLLPHPDIVVASDRTKGLALEADKLALASKNPARPAPERFVTAMEIPQH